MQIHLINILNTMFSSEETVESKIDSLVEQLENDKKNGNIKLMNDGLFVIDNIDTKNLGSNFDICEPKEKKEENINYI